MGSRPATSTAMITAVLIAWAAIALFVIALPLAAWWLGGRRFWLRRDAAAGREAQLARLGQEMVQRHGLTSTEADQVRRAATWGRALAEPRLRTATVAWARRLVEMDERRRAERPQLRTSLVVVVALWAALVLARIVFAVATGRWGDVNWGTVVVYTLFAAQGWRRLTGPQRAIQRNSSPVDA